ncbi:MAG: hypothetical protein AAF802_21965 [Planctomycetota bacterium]
MRFRPYLFLLSVAACLACNAMVSAATTVSLVSQIDGSGTISEDQVTGAFARIDLDPDGIYNLADPGQLFSSIDVFPNEGNFTIGSFEYDEAMITGVGVETVAITSLDTSGFWMTESNTTDISDEALDLWFFGSPNDFDFEAFDAGDTATFTNGVLTSLDATTGIEYSMFDGAANRVAWTGDLTLSGDTITFSINDTQNFDLGGFGGVVASNFVLSLNGTVNAVSVIPEPGFSTVLFVCTGVLSVRRRRR